MAADLRAHLPGLEPEREVSDWGRSERTARALDRTIVQFLYSRWFSVQVAGAENVPDIGGVLLLADGEGPLVYDAVMIGRALAQEHPRGRPVHLATARRFSGIPGLGMLVTKLGAVGAHPENLHRLLWDEGEAVLLFRSEEVSVADVVARAGVPVVQVEVRRAAGAIPIVSRLGSRWLPVPGQLTISFSEPAEPARLPTRAAAQ